jgi:hypothetical protein
VTIAEVVDLIELGTAIDARRRSAPTATERAPTMSIVVSVQTRAEFDRDDDRVDLDRLGAVVSRDRVRGFRLRANVAGAFERTPYAPCCSGTHSSSDQLQPLGWP